MDLWAHSSVEHVDTVIGVEVVANDDSEQYEFWVKGAVCAMQAYDGIRIGSDEPGHADHLAKVFAERATCALLTYETGVGPIYV
jgi:hypothetical protein